MNLFDLKGKTALVTGGNGGIGLAMAQGLAAAGAKVAIAGRDKAKNAAALKALPGAIAIQADLKEEKACRAMIEEAAGQLGRLDILVNNAGLGPENPAEDVREEDFDLTVAVNLKGTFFASQAARQMSRRAASISVTILASLKAIAWFMMIGRPNAWRCLA